MPDESPNLAQATVRGAAWTYVAFYSGKAIVFISTIILARLLTKDDFGVVGYAVTAISFLDIIKDLGIGSALIYHKEDPHAANTAFWLSVVIGCLICVGAWLVAPAIGAFFNDPRAIPVTQVLALNFPISALGSVQEALLIKKLAFNRKFIPDFAQAMSKGIFSIVLAVVGFGPWSLIVGHLIGTSVSVIVVWYLTTWRPTFIIDRPIARSLLSFGLPLVGVNIVAIFVLNIDYLLVGRYLGAEALGVYTLAFRIPDLVILQFCGLIASVIFPIFAKIRTNPNALSQAFLHTTCYVTLITVPLGLGMALTARPFVLTIFTDKWLDTIPVLQAIAIYSLLLSVGYNAGDVYKAQGRPGVLTWLLIIRAGLLVPGLLWAVTVPASVAAVGWVQAATAFVGGGLNLFVATRMLKMPLAPILEAMKPAVLAGGCMVLAVLGTLFVLADAPAWIQLIASISVGAVVYLGALWLWQRPIVIEAGQIARSALLRR